VKTKRRDFTRRCGSILLKSLRSTATDPVLDASLDGFWIQWGILLAFSLMCCFHIVVYYLIDGPFIERMEMMCTKEWSSGSEFRLRAKITSTPRKNRFQAATARSTVSRRYGEI